MFCGKQRESGVTHSNLSSQGFAGFDGAGLARYD